MSMISERRDAGLKVHYAIGYAILTPLASHLAMF